MFNQPDLLWALAKEHQRNLIADADTYRLVTAARGLRRRARANADQPANDAVARGRPADVRAACEQLAAAPAADFGRDGRGPVAASPARRFTGGVALRDRRTR